MSSWMSHTSSSALSLRQPSTEQKEKRRRNTSSPKQQEGGEGKAGSRMSSNRRISSSTTAQQQDIVRRISNRTIQQQQEHQDERDNDRRSGTTTQEQASSRRIGGSSSTQQQHQQPSLASSFPASHGKSNVEQWMQEMREKATSLRGVDLLTESGIAAKGPTLPQSKPHHALTLHEEIALKRKQLEARKAAQQQAETSPVFSRSSTPSHLQKQDHQFTSPFTLAISERAKSLFDGVGKGGNGAGPSPPYSSMESSNEEDAWADSVDFSLIPTSTFSLSTTFIARGEPQHQALAPPPPLPLPPPSSKHQHHHHEQQQQKYTEGDKGKKIAKVTSVPSSSTTDRRRTSGGSTSLHLQHTAASARKKRLSLTATNRNGSSNGHDTFSAISTSRSTSRRNHQKKGDLVCWRISSSSSLSPTHPRSHPPAVVVVALPPSSIAPPSSSAACNKQQKQQQQKEKEEAPFLPPSSIAPHSSDSGNQHQQQQEKKAPFLPPSSVASHQVHTISIEQQQQQQESSFIIDQQAHHFLRKQQQQEEEESSFINDQQPPQQHLVPQLQEPLDDPPSPLYHQYEALPSSASSPFVILPPLPAIPMLPHQHHHQHHEQQQQEGRPMKNSQYHDKQRIGKDNQQQQQQQQQQKPYEEDANSPVSDRKREEEDRRHQQDRPRRNIHCHNRQRMEEDHQHHHQQQQPEGRPRRNSHCHDKQRMEKDNQQQQHQQLPYEEEDTYVNGRRQEGDRRHQLRYEKERKRVMMRYLQNLKDLESAAEQVSMLQEEVEMVRQASIQSHTRLALEHEEAIQAMRREVKALQKQLLKAQEGHHKEIAQLQAEHREQVSKAKEGYVREGLKWIESGELNGMDSNHLESQIREARDAMKVMERLNGDLQAKLALTENENMALKEDLLRATTSLLHAISNKCSDHHHHPHKHDPYSSHAAAETANSKSKKKEIIDKQMKQEGGGGGKGLILNDGEDVACFSREREYRELLQQSQEGERRAHALLIQIFGKRVMTAMLDLVEKEGQPLDEVARQVILGASSSDSESNVKLNTSSRVMGGGIGGASSRGQAFLSSLRRAKGGTMHHDEGDAAGSSNTVGNDPFEAMVAKANLDRGIGDMIQTLNISSY